MSNLTLNLTVTERTLKKIQGLAKVANLKPQQINDLLGESLEAQLDDLILDHTKSFLKELGVVVPMDSQAIKPPVREEVDTSLNFDMGSDFESAAGGLGARVEDFEKMDEELNDINKQESPLDSKPPSKEEYSTNYEDEEDEVVDSPDAEDEDQDTLIFSTNDDDTKEEDSDMSVKNRLGQDTEYEDETMRLAQEALDNDEFELPSSIAADASASFLDSEDEDELEGGATEDGFIPKKERKSPKGSGFDRSDVPTGEDGYVPDVLPVDYGIDKISGEGTDRESTDFFMKLMQGASGDKSRRG